jgi:hypothetical protein
MADSGKLDVDENLIWSWLLNWNLLKLNLYKLISKRGFRDIGG